MEICTKVSLTGAESLVRFLMAIGVKRIFCITGAGNLAIVDAIFNEPSIDIVFMHHEQAAVMAAQGYARITGNIGVMLATTGGGTSNVMTGVLSAHLDSTPVLIISGNESSFHCESHQGKRSYGVQGFDSVATLNPITKKSVRLSQGDCPFEVAWDLANLAQNDRCGPVHLDFPMDLQRAVTCENHIHESQAVHHSVPSHDYSSLILECLNQLKSAKEPLLYLGNGCRNPKVYFKLKKLLSILEVPYLVSWSAIDLFQESDPLNVGRVGIYGDRHANLLLQECDFLLSIGTRLSIPQVGYDRSDFARKASKWIVEVDPTECMKHEETDAKVLNMQADAFLGSTLDFLDNDPSLQRRNGAEKWLHKIRTHKSVYPRDSEMQIGPRTEEYIHSTDFILYLNRVMHDDAIVVTDVGAGLLSGHYAYAHRGSQRFFTSQGLGEMGFGLPAAIGAHFARPHSQLVCLNTDGAIMFNLQEMQTVRHHQIPMKLVIFNNNGYAMIRISQENLFEGRLMGSTVDSGLSFPSFQEVAKTFGFDYIRVQTKNDLNEELRRNLDSSSSVLVEVIMDPSQRYLPRLGTRKRADGSLFSPPLEDLDPPLDLSKASMAPDPQSEPNSTAVSSDSASQLQ